MKNVFFLLMFLAGLPAFSQPQNNGIGINTTGNNPDPSAALDIDFNNKGLLIPRLTTIQRDAIQNPAVSLQIYNTTTNCLQIYMPTTGWRDISCDCNNSPSSLVSFSFADTATINTNIPFTSPTSGVSFTWTFDQGSPATSNQQSPTVTWSAPGTYAVTLTATDNQGCSTTINGTIVIINCPLPQMFSFTNCSQTGNTGPSQIQCNNAYNNTPLNGTVTVSGGIQEWTVPHTGVYEIEAAGAKGYNTYSGRGAIIQGRLNLNMGDVLRILVGQEGGCCVASGTEQYGGGGGTYVVALAGNTPLIVAGGGGGANGNLVSIHPGSDGQTTTSGHVGVGANTNGAGGTNGSGGGTAASAGGGGGFSGDGGGGIGGGLAFLNGGQGGTSSSSGGWGGFGGGGGATSWNNRRGGGGGGYSGGGASGSSTTTNQIGGGGGSWIDASATNVATSDGQYNNQASFNGSPITNLNNYNSGHGYVNIQLVCP